MLELVPVTLREANGFVQQYHRHHKQVAGHKFSIGVAQDGRLVGAVTHVLVSDPQRGYGILAENMIRQADSCRQAQMS